TKMHETVGYQEMTSHDYLSSDRLVQRTEFADGTAAVANFASEDRTVTLGSRRLVLPPDGFAVSSTKLSDYRVIEGDYLVCGVETDDLLYVRRTPLKEGTESVQQIWKTGDGNAMARLKGDSLTITANWITRAFADGYVVYRVDEKGRRAENVKVAVSLTEGAGQITFPEEGHYEILWGTAVQACDLAVSLKSISPSGVWTGRSMGICEVQVENCGMLMSSGKLTVYADKIDPLRKLAEAEFKKLMGGEKQIMTMKVEPLRMGGEHTLIFVAMGDKPELLETNNIIRVRQDVALPLNRYPLRKTFTLDSGDSPRVLEPVSMSLDLKDICHHGDGLLHPEDVHLLQKRADGNWTQVKYAQFDPDEGFDGKTKLMGRLDFSFDAPANTKVEFMIVARQGKDAGFAPLGMDLMVGPENGELVYFGETYSVGFRDGTIMDWAPGRRYNGGKDFMGCLLVSSGETGWAREEQAQLERFEIVRSGSAVTEIFVSKILKTGNRYQTRYFLYPGRLVVLASLEREQGGLYSRGFYSREADYLDDKGFKAHMGDGKQASGIYGANKNPKWF
ncbi:MAG: hypothetical protein IKS67_05600, partial [Victivallales bacterium]|nr:hypothetical protein [Victivallales bacterium]